MRISYVGMEDAPSINIIEDLKEKSDRYDYVFVVIFLHF